MVPVEVVVPEVGEVGMTVTFVTWHKADGDDITEGEPLFQVDTEKTLFDVDALASGRLADLRVGPGDEVEPRQVVALLLASGEAVPPRNDEDRNRPDAADATPAVGAAPNPSFPSDRSARSAASPRARALAAELGVDLASIAAAGPGLISEADVRRAADEQRAGDAAAEPGQNAGPAPAATGAAADRSNRIRKAVAELTTRSWAEVPHFYARLDADLTSGLERAKPLPLVVAALARALRDVPDTHLGWEVGRAIAARASIDIGILVDTPEGLLLPAIHDVDRLTIAELAEAIRAAADRARAGRLEAGDFGPRSATVSNLGAFAVDEFAGIVAVPDPFLLSVGRASTRPRWDGSAWQPRTIASLTLAVDHRILDGADAGRLLSALEARLEQVDWLA